jgi:hypothetical protein
MKSVTIRVTHTDFSHRSLSKSSPASRRTDIRRSLLESTLSSSKSNEVLDKQPSSLS